MKSEKYLEKICSFGGNKSVRKCRLKPASTGNWALHGFWQSWPQAGKGLQAFVQQGLWSSNELNLKVTQEKNFLILTQIGCFHTVTPVLIHWWIWNDAQSLIL